jgi:trk system potassium uptake protein
MVEVIGSIRQYPARVSFLTYFFVISLGAATLRLPISHGGGEPISTLDAVFTATSATCVTGLTVRSTGNEFSWVGQAIILLLIQAGGIGILTITMFVAFGWKSRAGLRERAVVAETLGVHAANLKSILAQVLVMTALFEGIGFAILTVRNLFDMPLPQAMWHALFHSIAAYCNAGFGLLDDNLIRYQGDIVVNLTICGLIIIGGLGVPVLIDLRRTAEGPWNERWRHLYLHSKFMIVGTAVLITVGTLGILSLEWDGVLRNLPWKDRVLVAFFQSVTPRTAGFNTVEISKLTNATLYLIILLMFVGAGPCSTGGGFKVSTLYTILVRAWSSLRGHSRVKVFGRSISEEAVNRAIVAAMMFAAVSVVGLTALLVYEQSGKTHTKAGGPFLDAAFEVTSALGTVGLSTGLTPKLTIPGRWIIIVLMFIGRLGPLGVAIALSRNEQKRPVELPQEDPLIG